jgi:drug/metabolite transporter (DMT)-like permease
MAARGNIPPPVKASLWMAGTVLSFTLMGVCGRELSAELNTFQTLFWRSLVGGIAILPILYYHGWGHARTQRLGAQIFRNLAHFAGSYGWFYAIGVISLAEVFALEFTTPIWTALLAFLFLKERLSVARVAAIALGFAGILLITRPGVEAIHPAALAVLGAAFAYAVSYAVVKSLTATESPLTILVYMTALQLPVTLALSVDGWVWPSFAVLPWVVMIGLTSLSAHYCMARAFQQADAMLVVPLDFLRLPLIAVLGLLFYGEALNPWVLGGAALVFAANILNIRFAR